MILFTYQTASIDEDTLVAPKIIKKLPKVVQVKTGESTILEVKATGKPTPAPKWLKANEEIIPSDDYLIENHPDGTSVLTITNVQSDAIDKITFEAISRAGVAKTTTKLQVVEGIFSHAKISTLNGLQKFEQIFIWRTPCR